VNSGEIHYGGINSLPKESHLRINPKLDSELSAFMAQATRHRAISSENQIWEKVERALRARWLGW
jgi:hypothetical protein